MRGRAAVGRANAEDEFRIEAGRVHRGQVGCDEDAGLADRRAGRSATQQVKQHLPADVDHVGGARAHCGACFTGNYPMPVQLEMDKLALENLQTKPVESEYCQAAVMPPE